MHLGKRCSARDSGTYRPACGELWALTEKSPATTASYVLNTNTMKIHYPSCSQVKKIAPQNYATSNATEAELLAQGYTTCGVCH